MTLIWQFYCTSVKFSVQIDNFFALILQNELAAKLNAGANFGGFGGPRRPVSQISSPDPSGTPGLKDFTRVAVPSSPSPSTPPDSPLVTDENLSSEKPSTSSYMESAMLRINLNKQRKHRPATRFANQQSAPQALMATSDISFTSPLDNIVEEENLSPSVFQDTAIPSKSAVAVTTKLRHVGGRFFSLIDNFILEIDLQCKWIAEKEKSTKMRVEMGIKNIWMPRIKWAQLDNHSSQ